MKTRIILGVFALLGLGWGLGGKPAAADPVAPVERGPSVVRVAEVKQQTATTERRFSGWLQARQRAQLAFTVGGRLAQRSVSLGDTVADGDRLGRLDRKPLRNRLRTAAAGRARANAQLRRASNDKQRVQTLHAAAAVGSAELDTATSEVAVFEAAAAGATADVAEAQRVLGEATLRAPFAGVVTQVFFEPGEFVPPGSPVVAISGTGELELEVDITEDLLDDVPVGREVRIRLPRLDGRTVPGTVIAVAQAAPDRGRLFALRVRVDAGENLLAGLSAELVLPVAQPQGLTVPVEAVINPGGMHPAIFVVREGVAQRIDVDVLSVRGTRVLVEGPAVAGEPVVIGGLSGLVPGEPVAVIQ